MMNWSSRLEMPFSRSLPALVPVQRNQLGGQVAGGARRVNSRAGREGVADVAVAVSEY